LQAQVIISEMFTEDNPTDDKFVELYNSGCEDLSLEGWSLTIVTNLGHAIAETQQSFSFGNLDSISVGGTFLISSYSTTATNGIDGFANSSQTYIDFNGQEYDGAILSNGPVIVDYAIPGTSNSDFYGSSIIFRKPNVCNGNTSFDISEWSVSATSSVADASPGIHVSNCLSTPPSITITGSSSLCATDLPSSYFATPLGGTFSGNGISSSGDFDPSVVGPGANKIYYSVPYGISCTTVDSFEIQVQDFNLLVTIGPNDTLCPDGSATISGNFPGTIIGAVTGPSIDASVLGSGDFYITFTAVSNGCTKSVADTFHILPTPGSNAITILGDDNLCINDPPEDYFGTSSLGPGSFSGNGMTGGVFDPSSVSPGFHWIYYSVNYGPSCTAVDSFEIEVYDFPLNVVVGTNDTLCPEDVVTISSNHLPISITGDITSNQIDATVLGPGSYNYTFTVLNNGCFKSTSESFEILTPISFNWSHDDSLCFQSGPIPISVSPTGGGLSGPGVNGNQFYPISVTDGPQTIIYSYIDNNNCPNTSSTVIEILPDPGLNSTLSDTLCIGILPPQSVDPAGALMVGHGVSNNIFTPMTAGQGTHYLTITYVDAAQCAFKEVQSVHVEDFANAGIGTNIAPCANISTISLWDQLSGNDPGGVWLDSNLDTVYNPVLSASSLISGPYQYIVGNSCGDSVAFVNVTIASPIVALAGPDIWINSGSTATFSNANISGGTPPYTIEWSPAGILVDSSLLNPTTDPLNTSTTFIMQVWDSQGCMDSSQITVNVTALPLSATVTNLNPTICEGDSAEFSVVAIGGSGTPTFAWSNSGVFVNPNSNNPMAAPISSGYFVVTVSDNIGYVVDSVYVTVLPPPSVSLNSLPSYCLDDPINDLSTFGSPSGGTWGPGGLITSAGSFYPLNAGPGDHEIIYTVSNTNGCSRSDTQIVHIDTLPTVSLAPFSNVCQSSPNVILTGGSPTGGIYTGTGVSGGIFNHSTLGAGSYPINYFYSDPNTGCSASAVEQIDLVSGPNVQLIIPSSQSTVCTGDAPFTINNLSPVGGILSGDGLNGNTFYPDSVNGSSALIQYSFTDANGCSGTDTKVITILQSPLVSIGAIGDQCLNTAPFALSGSLPSNTGIYSGPGVVANVFSPSFAGIGQHTIEYDYTDVFGCSGVDSVEIEVFDNPVAAMGALPSLCLSDPSFAITVGSPAGGTYSGTGLSGGLFVPSIAGIGDHEITYTYTDMNGCIGTASDTVTVLGSPGLYFPNLPAICENGSPLTLNQGVPTGGTYGGLGVAGGQFDPNTLGPGIYQLSYAFTDALGCGDTTYSSIQVLAKPTITFNNPPDICSNDGPTPIATALPSGGTYSGTGISSAILDPTMTGAGTSTIYYNYTDSQGCSNNDSASVLVHPFVHVSHTAVPSLCFNADPIPLNGGTPSGGMYSGLGVVGNNFDPNAAGPGLKAVQYEYTDANGCSDDTTLFIEVFSLPSTSFSPPAGVCTDAAIINLNSGSPVGGTYFGSGVLAGTFDPALNGPGVFDLYYAYTDANGCSDTASSSIQVFSATNVSHAPVQAVCDNSPPFTLFGGNPGGGSYSGPGVIGGQFIPAITGSGNHQVSYTYTNIYGCISDTSFMVEVRDKPLVSLDSFPWICANDTAHILIEGFPAGGTYNGTGVNGNTFDPNINGPGIFNISYSYTDNVGCSNDTSRNFHVVIPPPVPTITETNGILLCNWGFYQYQWYFSGVPISGADSIVYTPTESGNYTVELIDRFGCTNISVPYYALSIEDYQQQTVKVYPVPAVNELIIEANFEIESIKMYDALGRPATIRMDLVEDSKWTLDVSHLSNGVYFIQCNGIYGSKTVQIIKEE